ncbi:MAG: leucine-rich repeat protein, partial [Clostridia bacterium]|nr:leucine-rich repeat protein [Clostridia bacterium]
PSIWDRKPEADDNTVSGYCTINKYNEYSNVKWEYHNIGTTADPEWTLYFFIDENAPAENTSCVVSSSARLTSHMKGQGNPTSSGTYYGYANSSGAEKYLPYYIENPTLFSSLKYISIAEGINELYGACFIAAPCEAVELPTTLTTAIGFGSFKNMAKLHTVYTRGSDIVKGTADFSNVARIRFTNSQYTFAGCSAIEQYIFKSNVNFGSASTSKLLYGSFMNNTSLKSFNYPTATSAGKTIEKQAFAGCSSLEEITFGNNITSIASDAFENCTALKAIWAPIGSTAHAFALENSYDTNHTLVSDSDANVLMTYDPETQTVSFLNNPEVTPDWAYQFTAEYAKTFINAYKNYAVKAYIDSFGKIRTYNYSFFDNWPSLKEVHFKNEMPRIEIRDGYYLFNNCDALTTVWCGEEAAKQDNVVHFPSLSASLSETQLSELTENLLYDCGAVKSVILPDKAYSITANTFYNCSSLKELTIPASVTGIADDAFFGCTSLRKINLLAPSSIITAGSVNGVKGLVIYTQSAEDADAINTTLAEGGVATSTAFAFYKTGMSIGGYSVRTTAKNGLRTHFIFDKFAVSGYDLIEYGTLSAAAKTWANYSQSYGADDSVLKLEGGEFVTPNDASIVKTPIYQNGNYVNNSVDLANGNRHFSVTIVNFIGEDQIKAELVSVGYEIWEKDGNYYVLFTHEDAYGYDTISLYKTTLGMLSDKVISVSMDENDPVWGTLNACEKTEVTTTDADITAYTFTDPINTDKVIAIYLTASEAETALTDLGIDYESRSNVSAFVFGKNVIYDLPLIDAYWEEHIEEKIASIPEGKSFIAYTDTHYQSNGERNTGKAPELIQYVRKRTGIDKVFNLGDPYSGEDTADEAEQFFELTVGEYFHDVFGDDAFFAVGNHDANYVSSFNDDLTSEEEKSIAYKYLLPDTKIYEIGYAPLEGRPGIVFDNAMVKLADSLDYTVAEEFGLTEEYLKKEFIAWAKQHYYFDDADNKIRFITLNTGNCGIVEYYLFDKMFWNAVFPTQYNFVYDALCTA